MICGLLTSPKLTGVGDNQNYSSTKEKSIAESSLRTVNLHLSDTVYNT